MEKIVYSLHSVHPPLLLTSVHPPLYSFILFSSLFFSPLLFFSSLLLSTHFFSPLLFSSLLSSLLFFQELDEAARRRFVKRI